MRSSIGIANLQKVFITCLVMKFFEGTFSTKNINAVQLQVHRSS